ncbi:MAG: alpha/beta hydrolase [Nitrospiraceae bacterium]|nr:alpha/beta hydrolase [Nitrospiraceae bacterium]
MKAWARRMLLYPVLIVSGLYLVILGYAWLRQGSMLYFPSREITLTPADIGLVYEDVTLTTSDGLKIAAWHIPAGTPAARGVVLFSHGNAGNISDRLDSIRIFHSLNLAVLIYDYRGYGRSEGSPTEEGTYKDALAVWDHLVHVRGIQPEKIILFGRSLGSAVATEVALRKKAGALIIESGFTSVPDLGSRFYPFLPVRLIARFRYATVDKVGRITIPKLIIHSPRDEIIPFEHGRALFEKAAEPREFLQIRGGHNEGFLVSGGLYVSGLEGFISKHF